ncbi:hypothetical protein EMPS_02890 [Entomortierella parvispora]|uniref:Uncharacterized protein n=1 Tax=Entomortierella parvispora TaxID=205924 RepID=A0A9P3LTX0_9FUNG|nr:hypothetical protein EMPS_02890 [Entomortierella parvispora]
MPSTVDKDFSLSLSVARLLSLDGRPRLESSVVRMVNDILAVNSTRPLERVNSASVPASERANSASIPASERANSPPQRPSSPPQRQSSLSQRSSASPQRRSSSPAAAHRIGSSSHHSLGTAAKRPDLGSLNEGPTSQNQGIKSPSWSISSNEALFSDDDDWQVISQEKGVIVISDDSSDDDGQGSMPPRVSYADALKRSTVLASRPASLFPNDSNVSSSGNQGKAISVATEAAPCTDAVSNSFPSNVGGYSNELQDQRWVDVRVIPGPPSESVIPGAVKVVAPSASSKPDVISADTTLGVSTKRDKPGVKTSGATHRSSSLGLAQVISRTRERGAILVPDVHSRNRSGLSMFYPPTLTQTSPYTRGEDVSSEDGPRSSPLHESSDEFPNGDVHLIRLLSDYSSLQLARSVGWATKVTSQYTLRTSGKVIRKRCLGVSRCPLPYCPYVRRPKVSAAAENTTFSSSQLSQELEDDDAICRVHQLPLEPTGCSATMDLVQAGVDRIELIHRGFHEHPKPLPARASMVALNDLETMVNTAPEAKPKHLVIGTATRPSISIKHPVLHNLGYTRYLRLRSLNHGKTTDNLGELANLESKLGFHFLQSHSLEAKAGHICVQTEFLRQRCRGPLTHMQTDSFHGAVFEIHIKDANITCTVAYCAFAAKVIPIVISVLFGKSAEHYKRHFSVVLQSLEYKSWEEFDDNFPGMTCDFSDAERKGFQAAIAEHYNVSVDIVSLEGHYQFCTVHYRRSLRRVCREASVIPAARSDEFYFIAESLTREGMTLVEFEESVAYLLEQFPRARNWIAWYMNADRKSLIYPALRGHPHVLETLALDTNAQEGFGAHLRNYLERTAPRGGIVKCVEAIALYQQSFARDYDHVLRGGKLTYGKRPPVPESYINDGRAPDNAKALRAAQVKDEARRKRESARYKPKVPKDLLQKPKQGRRLGSQNKAPSSREIFDHNTFGIPWGVEPSKLSGNARFALTNTCALDSSLMAWYMLVSLSGATLPPAMISSTVGLALLSVMAHLHARRYDMARRLWCTDVMKLPGNRHHDLYLSLEAVFLDLVPGLTRFEVSRVSSCSVPGCPQEVNHAAPRSVIMLSPDIITQKTFNEALSASFPHSCTKRVAGFNITGHSRQEWTITDEGEESWTACSGQRSQGPMLVAEYPPVLLFGLCPRIQEQSTPGAVDHACFRLEI